jgi:branched-chain amino acid transport system substrate-binding protein
MFSYIRSATMRSFFAFAAMMMLLASSVHSEPVRISASLSLTGKYAELGDMQLKGYRLWEADVNRKGGLLGRPVQLTVHDDKSDPVFASELYKRFVTIDRADLVFAPYSSELTAAIAPITEKYGYPVLAVSAGATALWQHGYRYLFGVPSPANYSTVNFLELVIKQGFSRMAIVSADDPFSKDVCSGAREWGKRFGLNVVFADEFKVGTSRLHIDAIVQKAHASNAQIFMICGHFEEAVNARLAIKKIGWVPHAYYATLGPLIQKFYDVLKDDADGTFSSSPWEPDSRFPGAKEFNDGFSKNNRQMPSYLAALAYAGGQILEVGVKNTKSLNREKLRESLSSLDALTIVGRYGVDHTGKQIRQFTTVVQWQNGKKQTVGPEEMLNAKPIWK